MYIYNKYFIYLYIDIYYFLCFVACQNDGPNIFQFQLCPSASVFIGFSQPPFRVPIFTSFTLKQLSAYGYSSSVSMCVCVWERVWERGRRKKPGKGKLCTRWCQLMMLIIDAFVSIFSYIPHPHLPIPSGY